MNNAHFFENNVFQGHNVVFEVHQFLRSGKSNTSLGRVQDSPLFWEIARILASITCPILYHGRPQRFIRTKRI